MSEEKKIKLNKDKLESGVPVSEKDYRRVIAGQRKKNPYLNVSKNKSADKKSSPKSSQEKEYLQKVAADKHAELVK